MIHFGNNFFCHDVQCLFCANDYSNKFFYNLPRHFNYMYLFKYGCIACFIKIQWQKLIQTMNT